MKQALLLTEGQFMFLTGCMQFAISIAERDHMLAEVALAGWLAGPDFEKTRDEVVEIMHTAFKAGPGARS